MLNEGLSRTERFDNCCSVPYGQSSKDDEVTWSVLLSLVKRAASHVAAYISMRSSSAKLEASHVVAV